MCKFLTIITILFGISLSTIIFADPLNIYEKPESNSKVIATIKSGEGIIPIFCPEKSDWTKVANPKNGDIGWAKNSELKGPIVITKETRQQIIVDKDKEKQPQVYSVIQYSGPELKAQELKPEEAQKILKSMEKRREDMEKSMKKMREQIQKNITEMFEDFDKNFRAFSTLSR